MSNEVIEQQNAVPYNVMNNNIINETSEITDEEKKFMEELNEKYKDEQPTEDLVPGEADVVVDESGKTTIVEAGSAVSDVKVDPNSSDTMEKMMHPEQREDLLKSGITDEQFSDELKSTYDLSDDDVIAMVTILSKMQHGEKFSVYNAMPAKMQNLVTAAMVSNNIPGTAENRNIIARSLIEDIMADIKNDMSFVEFNDALKEIANIPSLMDFHAENCLETMEVKVPEAAEKLKDTKPEVAASLIAITEAWKDSYNFYAQNDLLDKSERTRNRITTDLDNYDKFVSNFNFASEKSSYIINDVNQITRVLSKILPEENIDHIKAFTILFIKACDAKYPDRNKPSDVAYIYYSIKNIASLEFVELDAALEFNKTLMANIKTLLNRIKEIDTANRERLANDPAAQKRARKKHHKK